MNTNRGLLKCSPIIAMVFASLIFVHDAGYGTSQWSRRTGFSCNACHTVFPRLNSFGEEFLRNGYQLAVAHEPTGEKPKPDMEYDVGGVSLDKIDHLLGFRLNMTAIQLETNSYQKDSASEKTSRLTLGSPVWIQLFVAGPIYTDISFFSELEYAQSAFKFNWFYFNFTNLGATQALNFQVGNISPLEFASYPNRLPQLPNLKGEVFLIKASDGKGEESLDMSSARPGIQYYGRNDWGLIYAGGSPGTKATDINNSLNYWGGFVLQLPDDAIEGFGGSTATIHYYAGTDTKNTGIEATSPQRDQIENKFIRISPQVNIRYKDMIDLQAAYVYGKDDNRGLVASPTGAFKYSGVAVECGYMPSEEWHVGLHYDKYSSQDKLPTGKPVIEFQRVVPAVTYVINQNIRASVYYEKNLSDIPTDQRVDKLYLNLRTMF